MKLQDIKASEQVPVYVNLIKEGGRKEFHSNLRWNGTELMCVKHDMFCKSYAWVASTDVTVKEILESNWEVQKKGTLPLDHRYGDPLL